MWFLKSAMSPSGNWSNGLKNVAVVIGAWQSFSAKSPGSLVDYLAQRMRNLMFLHWKCCCTLFFSLTCSWARCHHLVAWLSKHLNKMQWTIVEQYTRIQHSSKLLWHEHPAYQLAYFLFLFLSKIYCLNRGNAFRRNKTIIVCKQKWRTAQFNLLG